MNYTTPPPVITAQQAIERVQHDFDLGMAKRVDGLIRTVELLCIHRGWDSHNWSERGCYLHLEVSELIESLRGKGRSTPAEEAADVLLVFLSVLHGGGVDGAALGDAFAALCADIAAKVKGRDGKG